MILIHRTEDGAVQIDELKDGIRFFLDIEDNCIKITFGDDYRDRAFSVTSTVIGITGTDQEFPKEKLFFYNILRFVESYVIGEVIEHINDDNGDYLDLDSMMLFLNLELEGMEEDWEMEYANQEEENDEV